MTDPAWTFSATAAVQGLITSGPTVIGNNLVLTLDDSLFISGFSSTIRLRATPPNNVTANKTSWSLIPSLKGGGIDPVEAPTPATSTATSQPLVAVSKYTADGGSVYEVNRQVTYNITAKCNTATTGNLFVDTAKLVDVLPPGMTYISSTPPGGVYDAGTGTVTWNFDASDSSTMPAGCSAGSTGPTTFKVTATTPGTVPPNPRLVNNVTFSGNGPDATDPSGLTSTTSAQVPIQVVDTPAVGPGSPGYATISKTSLAPIPQPGITQSNQYVATYPGDWVPISSSPPYSVGAAAASFQTRVNYGLVDRYQTRIVDPLPCLDNNPSSNLFVSNSPTGATCQHPAFHTQVFTVQSAGFDPAINGLGRAYAAGWRPQVILTNGSTVTLNATSTPDPTSSSATFKIPAGSDVATIIIPPDPRLKNASLILTMWGFADLSLANHAGGLNQLTNTATATPYLDPSVPLAPVNASASIYTVPEYPQLGISKTFGSLGGGPSGTTVLNMVGSVNLPTAPLAHNVVLTDLLPLGLTWANPSASGTFTLSQGAGATTTTATATVQKIDDYQSSGRQLLRITISRSKFTSTGYWTITPPANFLEMVTPTELGTYANTDQIFLFGLAPSQILNVCTTPTQTGGGISPATFQSDNSLDLAGDGNLSEQYCQNQANLIVGGAGAAFALTKTVKGELDSIAKGPLGIGTTTSGGNGTYGLTWSNVGTDTLKNPVIYDILPYVGDTGVSGGQVGVARGSEFQPVFAGVNLPAGVTVQYSESTNPCRDEVYSNSVNTSCVNDWSSTPPSDLSQVAALRFTSSASYTRGNGFKVGIEVQVPTGIVNKIAWNSAATNALDQTDPSNHPLPAEPPKVGLVAPTTPTITTQTSDAVTTAFASISDAVTISGTGGAPGSLRWNLLGPISPVANSCDGLDWSAAPSFASGSVPVTGDGLVTVGPQSVGGGGCYTWEEVLTGTSWPYTATVGPGETDETTVVTPYPPSLDTTASISISGDGTQSISDSVVVGDIPPSAPAPTPLTWTLFGPVTPGPLGCEGLDWSSAPVLDTGTVPVAGNGTYVTPPVEATAPGCYSYQETLPATADSTAADMIAGQVGETVLITAPSIETRSSSSRVPPHHEVSDTVDLTGTNGGTGSLSWSLVGPVAPGTGGSCHGVDWSGAAIVASGTVQTTGDESLTIGPSKVSGPGCYSWTEELTATGAPGFPGPATSPAGHAHEVIDVPTLTPRITTSIQTSSPSPGVLSLVDDITVTGTGASTGSGQSSALTWTLLGPVAPRSGSCDGLAWGSAPIAATGNLTITHDGSVTTPPTTVRAIGCYTFIEQLAATTDASATTTQPGDPVETVLLSAQGGGGGLAFTGAELGVLGGAGVIALLGGAALLAISRRRRQA